MRTRTAYVAHMLAALACTALVTTSCSPDSTAPVAKQSPDPKVALQKLENLRSKYGWVGTYHTDGLAFIYARLDKNRKSLRSREDACREASKALKEFHRITRHGEVPFGLVDPSLSSETCGEPVDANVVSRNVSVNSPGARVRGELSVAAGDYLNRVTNVVYAATSRTALETDVNQIELSAATALPESEAGAVEAVASIALSSADYWADNLGYWTGLSTGTPAYFMGVDPGNSKIKLPSGYLGFVPPSWWSNKFLRGYLAVVGADAAGGARTAYMAWMAGPIGWDAVAASALYASSMAAISLLFF